MKLSIDRKPFTQFDYRGWTVWEWTGWKGTKAVADRDYECDRCDVVIRKGDPIFVSQAILRPAHWMCAHPDNALDEQHAQWLAYKGEGDSRRYIVAQCADMVIANIPASEYRKGESFEVVPSEYAINERTPGDIKEKAKTAGLARLERLIDRIEGEDVG